jgi:glycosyltransferase involved in cell wall biosynthesis
MSIQLVLSGQGVKLKDAGGVGRYSYELQRRVQSPRIQEYVPGAKVISWNVAPLVEYSAAHADSSTVAIQKLKSIARNWTPPAIFTAARQAYVSEKGAAQSLASLIDSADKIIFHEITNYSSSSEAARMLLLPSSRLCVTFHDIQDLYYPEYFTDVDLQYRRCHYAFYKDLAHQFFAISEFTKQTMIEKLGIPAEKIHVTYLGGDGFKGPVNPAADAFAKKFGRYLIYPAKFWKHKNHEFLLKAFSARKEEFRRQGIRLLLTGGFAESDVYTLTKLSQVAGIQDLVQVLGFQTTDALQALMKNAYFLIFPSLFEGFGMPVLEALESGCPVLCSRQGSLPEVAGDAAVYFNPREIDSLISVFDQLLKGAIDREKAIGKGKVQCLNFSWDETFRHTAERYRRLS